MQMDNNIELRKVMAADTVEAMRKSEKWRKKVMLGTYTVIGLLGIVLGVAMYYFRSAEYKPVAIGIIIFGGLIILGGAVFVPWLYKKYSTADRIEKMYEKYNKIANKE